MKVRFIAISIIFILTLNIFFPSMIVFAKEKNSNEIITGTYQFSSNEGNNIQSQNTFEYRDDCFTRSSFLGCKHLEILSIQAASASVSYYGAEIDQYEIDPSQNSYNITQLLESLKFSDVKTNKYYTTEKHENSMGVAVGNKKIIQDGKTYTLLAIIPRSAGYKEEWAGDLITGDGDIHEGFKLARDEILRYVKKYMQENNIKDDLKIWTTGWSRGAAVSNLIGGFFAGGGIEYFGENVTITPEDVYCYTIGTPKTIKDGLSKNEELSVSGNREDVQYVDDTPGEPFIYTKGGNVQSDDSIYDGIRSIISSNDVFSLLPLEEWGFTHYGKIVPLDQGLTSKSDMLEELNSISQYAYNQYTENGKIKEFKNKTFDLKTLSIIDGEGTTTITEFFKQRLKGMEDVASTNKKYQDENYQDALKSLAGIYGMLDAFFKSNMSNINIETSDAIQALAYTYLDYASKKLQEEGKAENETQAISIALEELLEYFTEEQIDNTAFTVDDFIRVFAKYMSDNENEPISDIVISGIINLVPEDKKGFLVAFKGFDKNNSPGNEVTNEQGLKAFIKACYYGADPECSYGAMYPDGLSVRNTLCMTMVFALSSDIPEIYTLLMGSNYEITGKNANFEDAVELILQKIKTVKNENGAVIKTYSNIAEVADDKIISAIDKLLETPIANSEALYGVEYKNEIDNQLNVLKANIDKAREIISSLLFYTENGFNIEQNIINVASFVTNAIQVPTNHYNEIYLAYSRTSNRYEEHFSEEEIEEEPENETENEEITNQQLKPEKVKETANNPKTGDPIMIWFGIMGISIIGIIGIIIYKNKKK